MTDFIFVDPEDPEAVGRAEADLMRTEITQPAVLAVDLALTRLLAAYGITPDFVMGHSLGEYGALVAAGVLSFEQALEAVSARGREMAGLRPQDPGAMAAASAPLEEVEEAVSRVDGYAVLANINSTAQAVVGGATEAVHRVAEMLEEGGHRVWILPVSHAFHTEIVAGVSEPLRRMLRRLDLSPPRIPVVANVSGELYPTGQGAEEEIVDILGRQVASPVQFVKGLQTLHEQGARVVVETGPKRALHGFASDVLGDDTLALFTNHPKNGDLPRSTRRCAVSTPQALAGRGSLRSRRGRPARRRLRLRPPPVPATSSRPVRRDAPAAPATRRCASWGACSSSSWITGAICSTAAGARAAASRW